MSGTSLPAGVAEDVARYITEELAPERVSFEMTHETNLLDAEILDSLAIFTLVEYLESHFRIHLEPEDIVLDNFATTNSIATLVARRREA